MEAQGNFYVYLTFRKKNKPGFTAIVKFKSKEKAEEIRKKWDGYILSESMVKLNISYFSCIYEDDCHAWLESIFGKDSKTYVKIE